MEKSKHRVKTNLCQQLSIIEAHCGSTSFGISKRWFMKPTAPITCNFKEIGRACRTHNSIVCQQMQTSPPPCPLLVSALYVSVISYRKPTYYNHFAHSTYFPITEFNASSIKRFNTCIELRLSQGIFWVKSSHSITPKLYTSALIISNKKQNVRIGGSVSLSQ